MRYLRLFARSFSRSFRASFAPTVVAVLTAGLLAFIGFSDITSTVAAVVVFYALAWSDDTGFAPRPDRGDRQVADFNALVTTAREEFWFDGDVLNLKPVAEDILQHMHENDATQCLIGAVRCGFVPVQDWRRSSSAVRYVWDVTADAVEQALLQDRKIRREIDRRRRQFQLNAQRAMPRS